VPAAAKSATKLTKALVALETYVSGLADLTIDYTSARLDDEPFSTSPTEGPLLGLLHRRMAARQQMRWSPRGAHLGTKSGQPSSTARSTRITATSAGVAAHFAGQHDRPMLGTVSRVPGGKFR
jgi:hypothetical protein